MKNSEEPINATETHNMETGDPDGFFLGLTKREYFAGLAMNALLSNPSQIDTTDFEWVAEHAIGYADELLKKLEETKIH